MSCLRELHRRPATVSGAQQHRKQLPVGENFWAVRQQPLPRSLGVGQSRMVMVVCACA